MILSKFELKMQIQFDNYNKERFNPLVRVILFYLMKCSVEHMLYDTLQIVKPSNDYHINKFIYLCYCVRVYSFV